MQRVSIDGVYTDSHYGLVRDVCLSHSHGVGANGSVHQFYTCGEDALITLWKNDHKYLSKHKRDCLKRKGNHGGNISNHKNMKKIKCTQPHTHTHIHSAFIEGLREEESFCLKQKVAV